MTVPGTGRAELGGYARDLPRGAAAPSNDARPSLQADLGSLTWPAGTSNPEAQAYFNQGYRLAWGFNHAEAARAFRAAQALDPGCAMCLWGEAWVLGPHINYPMEADANRRALAVLEQARRLTPFAGELRTALIEALAERYSPDPQADRKALDHAYAEAMEAVQQRFPAEPEVAMLTADALMNQQPWDYWEAGGHVPKGATDRILRLIENVLGVRHGSPIAANPLHPGAIHLYIHTVEASAEPERAAPHAARLAALMPGAGHLVHMPSHIWYRLGLWRESLEANRQAAVADEALLARGGASLLYAQGYYPHNLHFVMASALMGGDGQAAVGAAERLAGIVSDRARREVPWTQPIAAAPYVAHARFSAPEVVLALPAPGADFPFVRAHWHYARGEALARLGRAGEARGEVAAIGELAQTPGIAELGRLGVPGTDVLGIAAKVVQARLAQTEGDHARAATLFAEAAAAQDRLPYMEPPFWYYPVQQSLGAALLAAGRPGEAEAAFREALRRSPNNGWAAAGLLRVAEARGDGDGIAAARTLLQRNWFGNDLPALDRL
ncbi:tetratricopeptide repeat protein [Siccirubricoccus sp. G192]|uniref:tetratricopeptide repeat protein n=1 Tax=Siccirubricoccus sp. G192 TaxID=2849651 RepID=UPI001C2C90D5|nr:tetratricopeptide repeat protein [Siccirubricoccus sp. G192]MBV1797797.1 tetratricopeptide repeat protein [Siccirubricoccus sp. G192]